ncbi:MAG: flagellar basal body rod protein FlgB [Ruminococcaceae bacterium]|nr:flagellar basal body rod protein FlgB [Oscillospiraceae bacterium]
MFYDSKDFKILEAGTNLAWVSQNLHTQNISNIETPAYKPQSIAFDDLLRAALDGEVDASDVPDTVSAKILTSTTSLLPDGNNVDIEYESIQLYKDYAKYSFLLDKIKSQFDQYSYVLNSDFR